MSKMIDDETAGELFSATAAIHSFANPYNAAPGSLGECTVSLFQATVVVESETGKTEERGVIECKGEGDNVWVRLLVKGIEVHGLSGCEVCKRASEATSTIFGLPTK